MLPYTPYIRRCSLVIRRMARVAVFLALVSVAPPSVWAQIDETAQRELRAGLAKLRPMQVTISGHVIETTDVVGRDPYPDLPSNDDAALKRKPIGIGGITSGDRSYEWLWRDQCWRVLETVPAAGDLRLQDSSCDGTKWSFLDYPQANKRGARGHLDRPRGVPTTPATFAYMPGGVWAEDLLAGMKLEVLRPVRDATGHQLIECRGSAHGRNYLLQFDPSRGYAIARSTTEGGLYACEQSVTGWAQAGGLHIPVAMEQRMRSGAALTSPVWFSRRLTVSGLKATAPRQNEFKPKWPEGAQIVNVPEGKLYRYRNGRMEFIMYVGGRTPARMLMGWSVIGGAVVTGAALIYGLTKRRRRPKETHG